jgi:hypothetical protein
VSAADSTDQAAEESTDPNPPSSNMESTQGSRGRGRGRGRGQGIRNRGSATRGTGARENAPRQGNKSWTQSKNDKGKLELDLIVDWLTVEGNYQMWRSSEMSKRDVCEEVLIYLAKNGFEDQGRNWKGVEQQVNTHPPAVSSFVY